MNDYKAAFNEAVTDLINHKITDRSERIKAVEALTDAYIDSIGQTPDSAQLERLADYILAEELTDMHPDKMTREEYPFFSSWQFQRRQNKESSFGNVATVGVDGKDHRKMTRRKRRRAEDNYVDRSAKIRNKERRERYRIERKPGEVRTYYQQ
ncbi:hypothetical protein [Paenibacillus larvae]|uniref:Phage protein n=1 Tax=Paenibacillus larvae subsp. larvae TaxID=147375 RepID=A0A6C0QMI2_9BACL|nr:hypothetical protein [Paenibacillus larvae]QHZ49922.1 hypothetical protein ERICV_00741 [Paenibacillus larvae subsp. larvae]